MELRRNLEKVKDFCCIASLRELLVRLEVDLDDGVTDKINEFLDESLVLVESKKGVEPEETREAFFHDMRERMEAKQFSNVNQFMDQLEANIPSDHIQHKEAYGKDSRIYNICTKFLKNHDMEWLYEKLRDMAMARLLSSTICIKKFGGNYWQIWGRRLDAYFDDLKKKVTEPNFIKKRKKNANSVGYQRKIKQYFKTYVNKNHMLYCLHSNGTYSYFKKSKISVLAKKAKEFLDKVKFTEEEKNQYHVELGKELFDVIFPNNETGYPIQHEESKTAFCKAAADFILKFSKVNVEKIAKKYCKMNSAFFKVKKEYDLFMKDKDNEEKKAQIPDLISKIVKLETPAKNVRKFLEEFVRKCIPVSLIGPTNRMKLIKAIGRLTVMKKYEMMTYDEVIRQMNFREIFWLKRKMTRKNKGAIIAENNEYLRQLFYYMFNNFAIQLIRANFYVTEKHHEHNKLFFYCKPVWYMLVNLSMINLATLNLEKLNLVELDSEGRKNKEILFQRKKDLFMNTPCAKLRLVPKSDSVRPIMTFYKKFKDPKTHKSYRVGNYLKNAKIVLRTLKRSLADRQGFAVFDNYQIFDKYSKFKGNWKSKNKPTLFYGTMDIKKCYDSVELDRLFELLKKEDIFKDFYLISNFIKVIRNRRYAFRKKSSKSSKEKMKMSNLFILKQRDSAIPLEKLGSVKNYTLDEVTKKGKTIFLDRPRKRVVSKSDLMENITHVCKNVVIKFGNQVYKLKKGLPQGLSISSVLSSFYYSCLERRALESIYDSRIFSCEDDLIMRLTDDYLLISEDINKIKTIVERLKKQADQCNFRFNQKKLCFNFKYKDFTPEEEAIKTCRWIGKIIDIKDLEIEHVQILDEKEAFYTVSTNISYLEKYPAQVIKAKLKSFILNHNLFYLNPRVNSKQKIFDILKKILTSAYLKIKTYFNRILSDEAVSMRRKGCEHHELYIGKKIYEALIDCSMSVYSIFQESKGVIDHFEKEPLIKEIFEFFRETFLTLMKGDQNTKSKRKLFKFMRRKIKERMYEHWSDGKNRDIEIIE